MKKILTLFAVIMMAVTSLLAEEKINYSVRIEFVDYYDVQHTVWTSERLAEYCEVTLNIDALNKWKDVSKGDPVVVTNFKSDCFSLKGFRCGSTNYYGDTYFNQTVSDENTSNYGDMYLYIVVDALRMQPVATTSSSTYGKAEAARGSMSFEMPLITMDFWDNRFDPDKWYIYYKATPTNVGKFVRWVPETMITKYGGVTSAISAMDYIIGIAESMGYTDVPEYLILQKFKDAEFTIGVDEFEEFVKQCGIISSTYYQDLRMRAVFEEKPTVTLTASGDHGEIYSTTHTKVCSSTSLMSCREMTFTVPKYEDITLNVRDIDEGWEFDHWSIANYNYGSSLPYTHRATDDATVVAVFKKKVVIPTYDTVFVESDYGTVYDANGETLTYYEGSPCFIVDKGTTLRLNVKDIDDGWEFDYWDVNNNNVGSDLPYLYTSSNRAIVTAVYKEKTVTPTLDSYVIVAQRSKTTNWFYMTANLGTAQTKRYQAVDAQTADITKVNTSNLDDIYYWQIEENKYLKNGSDYSFWSSGNSAKFGQAMELTIANTGVYYTFSFVDSNEVTRYLSLNGTSGNNYFAYYSGTNQVYQLYLIKKGDVATGIDQVSQEQKAKSQKLIIDGQLYILRDGKMYNAQGVRVQ